MLKKFSLLLVMAAVMLSSCSSKMKSMKSEFFTVTPGVLEVVGSEIPVTIDGKFPAKFFNKNSVLTITPVLKYEGGEAMAEPVTFQGEKVRGNDRAICVKRAAKLLLQAEKILQAVLVQYFLQRLACPAANQQINVVKQVAQRLCQQHADGALAGAGHTD